MTRRTSRVARLRAAVAQCDPPLYVCTYSPGDGVTRYRFFTRPGNTYFGPDNGTYTALGWAEAVTYARGAGARGDLS